ncbi:apolipoprotein C-I [Antennarius striatus]|uniref:apolipoprotein C-I n=1 Tax=Antennarius striatus TaxID=241820 RepID=UPI0035AF4464
MRLYLAVAVLMLAFVAYAAAEEEQTFMERLTNFRQRAVELGQNAYARSVESLQQLANSEFVTKSKSYIQNTMDTIVERVKGSSS